MVGEGSEGRRELFNNIAPVYDQLNDALSLGLHRVWKVRTVGCADLTRVGLTRGQQATVQWACVPVGGRALDVCCGSGDLALRLAQAVGPAGSVTALDFAQAQLARAAEREAALLASDAARARVDWLQGDALALPFPDDHFHAATCGYGLRNVVDIPLALQQLLRVLRPGAKAALLDFNHSESPLTTVVQSAFLDALVVPAARAAGVAPEYEYLKQSIAAFPSGPQLQALARTAGFQKAVHYELAGGLMGVLVCTKAE